MPHNHTEDNARVTGAQHQQANDEVALRKIARAVLAIAKRQIEQAAPSPEATTEDEAHVEQQVAAGVA